MDESNSSDRLYLALHAEASASGVHPLPQPDRGSSPCQQGCPNVILDNYATHKHPKVRKWLDRHSRFTFHFTPTSSSWLNAVEGFFAKLSRRRLKPGVFRSVRDLNSIH
jgi:DDE superfamily endonuclease